jgi:hypothetical protein
MPKADKVVPFLIKRREREEAEAASATAAQKPLRYVDILPDDAEEWEMEKARHMDALDAAFPMWEPMAGETVEEWVMRETKQLRCPDWRCGKCDYGVSLDGDEDVRANWCADCAEERSMYEDEDKEWMCWEAESVSCLTKEWG